MLFCQWALLILTALGTVWRLGEVRDESADDMLRAVAAAALHWFLLYFAGAFSLIFP